MSVKIQLQGISGAIKDIEDYKNKVIADVKEALEESATNIEGHSKQRARVKTGTLKRSITHKASEDGLTQEIGSPLPYAGAIEYGTWRTNAFPYLNPSLEEEIPNLTKNIEKILEDNK